MLKRWETSGIAVLLQVALIVAATLSIGAAAAAAAAAAAGALNRLDIRVELDLGALPEKWAWSSADSVDLRDQVRDKIVEILTKQGRFEHWDFFAAAQGTFSLVLRVVMESDTRIKMILNGEAHASAEALGDALVFGIGDNLLVGHISKDRMADAVIRKFEYGLMIDERVLQKVQAWIYEVPLTDQAEWLERQSAARLGLEMGIAIRILSRSPEKLLTAVFKVECIKEESAGIEIRGHQIEAWGAGSSVEHLFRGKSASESALVVIPRVYTYAGRVESITPDKIDAVKLLRPIRVKLLRIRETAYESEILVPQG